MKQIRFSLVFTMVLALLGIGLMLTVRPAAAQSTGTVINSAVLSIYETSVSGEIVNVHEVTTAWTETGVTWNNFGNSFNPTPVVSFTASSVGWHTADVTSLVQAWVDNPTQNYGLLLAQGLTAHTEYNSSEFGTSAERPKLDVCYTRPAASMVCITIQRGVGQSTVADAYVWEASPDYNGGISAILYTGLYGGAANSMKFALLRFELRTPTAVQLQSLSARSSVAPELGLAAVGIVGAAGAVLLRRRRER
jgi:hypothetical protein